MILLILASVVAALLSATMFAMALLKMKNRSSIFENIYKILYLAIGAYFLFLSVTNYPISVETVTDYHYDNNTLQTSYGNIENVYPTVGDENKLIVVKTITGLHVHRWEIEP